MNPFVARKKAEWEELEKLVQRARKSPGALSAEELSRLDILYRRTAVSLAQVTSRTRDAALIKYLNDLTAGAHALIYVQPRQRVFDLLIPFLESGFGRSVVRTGRFHLASLALVLGGALIAYYAVQVDPAAAYALLPEGEFRQLGSTREQLIDVLQSGRDQNQSEKFFFASMLFQHNLKVSLLAMATGILAAAPTVFLMLLNGMILGAFTAVHHSHGIYAEYWAWVLPHGITEIGAIVLCGGIGLQIGCAAVCPGAISRSESLRRAGAEASRTVLGVAFMLFFAAVIESFLRQSTLPTASRLVFAAGTAAFWILYFWRSARIERAAALEFSAAQQV
jgi:uncharacterized membrane protein SpoIIM required for sporulation